MILTVTLNAAIDRTLSVPSFRLGRRHRAVDQTAIAGGKGINVARALRTLGRPVIAMGTAGGGVGTRIVDMLREEGIAADFVRIAEQSRTSTAVIDPTEGTTTEINERGPALTDEEIDRVVERILYVAHGASICVLCGSLPRGVPSDLYARLVGELRRIGVKAVVDCEGEPLRLALRAGPDLITPNVTEAEELVGHEFGEPDDRVAGLRTMVDLGARDAMMTSDDGCVALLSVDQGERAALRAHVEPREAVSPIGAGDAFLAGYVAGLYDGWEPEERVRFATACGAESVRHVGAGVIDPEQVQRLLPEIQVERLGEPALHHGR
jgi:1-phosphofructokinase/tagatose 6-phosphate kinase